MPPLHQIRHEIENKRSEAATAQDTIRRLYLQKLANYTGRDTILYASAYASHALDPSVFHAAMYTFQSTSCCKIIENHEGRGLYVVAKQK